MGAGLLSGHAPSDHFYVNILQKKHAVFSHQRHREIGDTALGKSDVPASYCLVLGHRS